MIVIALLSLSFGIFIGVVIGYCLDKRDLEAELRKKIRKNEYIRTLLAQIKVAKSQLFTWTETLAYFQTITDRDVSAECKEAESWISYLTKEIKYLEFVKCSLEVSGFNVNDTDL